MELVLGTTSSCDAVDPSLPCDEIETFISAKDAVGLMSQSYFPDAIRILYQPIMEFIRDTSTIEQVLEAVYHRKGHAAAVLQALEDNLVTVFKNCKCGIALAGLLLEQTSVLNRIFCMLANFTVFDAQHREIFLEPLAISTKNPFFKVVAAMLMSFSLYYEHLLAFVDYLLQKPISFRSLVALAGYPAFQELLETLFTVKLNRTNEVIERIATAWRTADFGGIVFEYLLRFFEYQSTVPTCIDSARALTEILINGVFVGLGFIIESVVEWIPELTEVILFAAPHSTSLDTTVGKWPPEELIYMRTNAFRSLVDLWICAVRYLMVRLHQSVASVYFYQDSPRYVRGDTIHLADMVSTGIYGISIFTRFLEVLGRCNFVEFYTEGVHSSELYFLLHKISAITRLLCITGDIRNAYFSRTFGYFPADYFTSPENTHTIPIIQKAQAYGLIPPSAILTAAGSCDVAIEEICETDTGALIEGSMLGIIRALLQSNIHLLAGRLLSDPKQNIPYLYSLGSTISTLLLEYRFYIPHLAEKVIGNSYIENLLSDTLETLSRVTEQGDVKPSQKRCSYSIRTVYGYTFVRNIYRMCTAEDDKAYCLKKRRQNMQNLEHSPDEPRGQRDGDPLASLLTPNSVIYKIKEAIGTGEQEPRPLT